MMDIREFPIILKGGGARVEGLGDELGPVLAEVQRDVGLIPLRNRVDESIFLSGLESEDVLEGSQGQVAVVGGGVVLVGRRVQNGVVKIVGWGGVGLGRTSRSQLVLQVLYHKL